MQKNIVRNTVFTVEFGILFVSGVECGAARRLCWTENRRATLALCSIMTVHCWYNNKLCAGTVLYSNKSSVFTKFQENQYSSLCIRKLYVAPKLLLHWSYCKLAAVLRRSVNVGKPFCIQVPTSKNLLPNFSEISKLCF